MSSLCALVVLTGGSICPLVSIFSDIFLLDDCFLIFFLIFSYKLTVSNGFSLMVWKCVAVTFSSSSFKWGGTLAKVGSSARFDLTCRFMLCFTEGLFVLHTKDLMMHSALFRSSFFLVFLSSIYLLTGYLFFYSQLYAASDYTDNRTIVTHNEMSLIPIHLEILYYLKGLLIWEILE